MKIVLCTYELRTCALCCNRLLDTELTTRVSDFSGINWIYSSIMPICVRCKKDRSSHEFVKVKRILKKCLSCRMTLEIKLHCMHGQRKGTCKLCGGSQICEHSKRKGTCKICGGSQICVHSKHKARCKLCRGSQICEHGMDKCWCKLCTDPIEVTVSSWIKHCKYGDKKRKQFDAENYIDRDFLHECLKKYEYCYYEDCRIKLQFTTYGSDLGTIERVNNNIGHTRSNCVLCCLKCNVIGKAKKTTF